MTIRKLKKTWPEEMERAGQNKLVWLGISTEIIAEARNDIYSY